MQKHECWCTVDCCSHHGFDSGVFSGGYWIYLSGLGGCDCATPASIVAGDVACNLLRRVLVHCLAALHAAVPYDPQSHTRMTHARTALVSH